MKKCLMVLLLFLSACGSPVHVKVHLEDKSMTESYTTHDPGGYKYACGLTIEGKYECGFKYFLPSSDYHPATYTFFLIYNDCPFTHISNEQEYYAYEKGDNLEMDVYTDELGNCYQEK